jgi:hypothetical protein
VQDAKGWVQFSTGFFAILGFKSLRSDSYRNLRLMDLAFLFCQNVELLMTD